MAFLPSKAETGQIVYPRLDNVLAEEADRVGHVGTEW